MNDIQVYALVGFIVLIVLNTLAIVIQETKFSSFMERYEREHDSSDLLKVMLSSSTPLDSPPNDSSDQNDIDEYWSSMNTPPFSDN